MWDILAWYYNTAAYLTLWTMGVVLVCLLVIVMSLNPKNNESIAYMMGLVSVMATILIWLLPFVVVIVIFSIAGDVRRSHYRGFRDEA